MDIQTAITILQTEIDNANAQVSTLTQGIQAKQLALDQLQGILQTFDTQLQQDDQTIADLQTQVTDLQNQTITPVTTPPISLPPQ